MDYIVSFEYSDTVCCANWVTTDDPTLIDTHYRKYKWYAYHEATSSEVEAAQNKGMPHRTYVRKEN